MSLEPIFDYYDTLRKEFIAGNPSWAESIVHENVREFLADEGIDKSRLRVVDCGAGPAPLSGKILGVYDGSQYVGIDGSEVMAQEGAQRIRHFKDRARFYKANFRDLSNPDMQSLSGWGNVAVALGAIDGEPSFAKHMHDLSQFVGEQGMLLSLDYYQGNQDTKAFRTSRDAKDLLTAGSSTYRNMLSGETQTLEGLKIRPYKLTLRDYLAFVASSNVLDFAMLYFNREFKQHDNTVPKPSLSQIEGFVRAAQNAGEKVTIGKTVKAPFNATIVTARITPGFRELTKELQAAGY